MPPTGNDHSTSSGHHRPLSLGVLLLVAGLAATGSVLAVPQRDRASTPFQPAGTVQSGPGADRFLADATPPRR